MTVNRRVVTISVGAVAVAGLALPAARHLTSSSSTGPVYTVAQVATGLSKQPQAWAGHTVTVRGTLVLVQGQGGGVSSDPGVWTGFCGTARDCSLGVPFDTTVHLVLIAHGTYTTVPGGADNPPIPPLLVMRYIVHRDKINRRLSDLFEPIAPGFIMQHIARLPVVYDILKTSIGLEAGTPRLYRIRVLVPQKSCPPFAGCDDSVLLDAPH